MREIGTMWQIGVLTGKPCTFWGPEWVIFGILAERFLKDLEVKLHIFSLLVQEDVNGEKLTVKKWWIFGADFFTVWCRFFSRFTPIFHGL